MNDLIACCGLNCEKCEAYIATINNDNALRESVAKKWSKLNNVDITPDMINCLGCMSEGVKTPYCDSLCEIRKCVVEKEYSSCAECKRLHICSRLSEITKSNKQALLNLEYKYTNK